jgi:MFS transporter, SP family, sugar:H+ symporter
LTAQNGVIAISHCTRPADDRHEESDVTDRRGAGHAPGNLGAGQGVNHGFIAGIVAVATIGGFMFGYDSGVINGTQKGLEAAFSLGHLGIGVNVGAILVGSAIGAFGAGRLADAIGRRRVMMLAALLFLVSALLADRSCSSWRGSSAAWASARRA